MPQVVDTKGVRWTYGVEHELADWDNQLPLPKGFARSPDYTIVNSNGIAAQPDPKHYRYGGEINTPPTPDIEGQAEILTMLIEKYQPKINYRSNLHLHIRVPGLRDSLPHLKQLQAYIHREIKPIIDRIEPIPQVTERIYPEENERRGAIKRRKRMLVSHHTFLTESRLQRQLSAKDIKRFFELECPADRSGRPMWHLQPRLAVGLRQLLQTDTIEFRHFPGTLSQERLVCCLEWCRDILLAAFREESAQSVYESRSWRFPKFLRYNYVQEIRYQATAAHGPLSRQQIDRNIQLILRGEFDESPAYQEAAQRVSGLPRKRLS